METLPMDVIMLILLRLPAKSVVRFKSVCMLWYDSINCPDFNHLHIEQSLATQSNLHFVVQTPVLHLADFDTFDNPIELDYPFKRPNHGGVQVLGSCHGILCLWNYDKIELTPFLYNPTTQTHIFLPYIPMNPPLYYTKSDINFGFVYDCFSRDYKCVRILMMFYKETRSFDCEVMVYSLLTKSWRRAQDLPYYFYLLRGESAFFNNTIHWVGEDGNENEEKVFLPILGCNLKDETFSSIGLPDIERTVPIKYMVVGVLDGCLSLTVNYTGYSDVWVMKEYGLAVSWSRVFSLRFQGELSHHSLEGLFSYSINRKELFVMRSHSFCGSIDLETMEVTDVKSDSFSYAHVCVENLLMLNDIDEGYEPA